MSTAQTYHDALFALSGNPIVAGARTALLASISDNEVIDVITHGLKAGIRREDLNAIATVVLDDLARTRKANDVPAPVEVKRDGDNSGIDGDSDGSGRKTVRDPSGPKVQKGEQPGLSKAAQHLPAQTPKSRGTLSSTASGKRKGSDITQAAKKTRKASPEPMDDEEDLVKQEDSAEDKSANVIAKETKEASSYPWPPTSSCASETDSDADTSLEKAAPRWLTQKSTVMTKSSLFDSGDNKEGYYSAALKFDRFRKLLGREVVQISDTDLEFWAPIRQGYDMHNWCEFPVSFVKEAARKFNEDYLKTAVNRKEFEKMMKDSKRTTKCVRLLLDRGKTPGSSSEPRYMRACTYCAATGKLCVTIDRFPGHKPRLLVHPLASKKCKDWRSMDFWVHK
ncbi:hypothetical protein J4E80_006900 [Alternaria sp. BMP 0032]|nr:hypothetical protein J4E80_006900 [Alternaria sp. BMP 0032]